MLLEGRTAIITGGASGIGLATARRLGREGAKLCVATINQEKLDRAAPALREEGYDAIGVQVDVRQMSQVEAMVQATIDAFGGIDILVCSHGVSTFGDVVDHDDALWERQIDVNLTGCYRCSKSVLPSMLQRKWGRIIYVSATSAYLGAAGWTAQCAAKTGLLGLTRALALEVAESGVTVNVICPAWVRTERAEYAASRQAAREGKAFEQYWQEAIESYPMKRVSEPEEQADLILYLASDAARGMTGRDLALTCGGTW